jgi:hypothetical protein
MWNRPPAGVVPIPRILDFFSEAEDSPEKTIEKIRTLSATQGARIIDLFLDSFVFSIFTLLTS